jgi:hypothetical protein
MQTRTRHAAVAALAACLLAGGDARGGHDAEYAPALKRYGGMITGLGAPDAAGNIYSFEAKKLPVAPDFGPGELRGWRLTLLAGKLFAKVYEVRENTGSSIIVTALDGPLNGLAVKDVFVVEDIAVVRQ